MESIVGPELISRENKIKTAELCTNPKFVGIYFGAHWAPPCRKFTTNLDKVYKELNKDSACFEVIFCSSDGSEEHFKANFAEMPWTAIDFNDDACKAKLN